MSTVTIVLLVILAVLIVGLIVLYFLGKKAQKKRDEQEAQLAANAQTVSMLIIDKKRLRLKDSGLPQVVIDQTPKMADGPAGPDGPLPRSGPFPAGRTRWTRSPPRAPAR